jgi:hypothetical protein
MAGAQQQPSGQDDSLALLWIVGGIIVVAVGLWYTNHAILSFILFKIRLAEISVVSLFSDTLNATRAQILATSPKEATLGFLGSISSQVGAVIAIPFAVLLTICCFLLYRASAQNRYRKIYSMHKLMSQEKRIGRRLLQW